MSILSMVAGGFSLLLTIAVNVIMAQNLAPDRRSTVPGFRFGDHRHSLRARNRMGRGALPLHSSLMGLTGDPVARFGVSPPAFLLYQTQQ